MDISVDSENDCLENIDFSYNNEEYLEGEFRFKWTCTITGAVGIGTYS